MKYCIVAILFLAMMWTPRFQFVKPEAEPPPISQDASMKKIRELVAFLDQELRREEKLLQLGYGTPDVVDQLRVYLAKVRHDLALYENKPEVIAEQIRIIIDVRNRDLQRVQRLKQMGIATEIDMVVARRRQESAQLIMAKLVGEEETVVKCLQKVVELGKREVALHQGSPNQGQSSWDLQNAKGRLRCAQFLLLKAENREERMIPHLRDVLEECETDLARELNLLRMKRSTIQDLYAVRVNLANARIRLANVEQRHDVVLQQLQELITLHETTLAKLERNLTLYKDGKMFFQAVIANDRLRLDKFSKCEPLDDLSLASMDL